MRSCRVNLPNRCYHLISRVAHRAFFLDVGHLIFRVRAFLLLIVVVPVDGIAQHIDSALAKTNNLVSIHIVPAKGNPSSPQVKTIYRPHVELVSSNAVAESASVDCIICIENSSEWPYEFGTPYSLSGYDCLEMDLMLDSGETVALKRRHPKYLSDKGEFVRILPRKKWEYPVSLDSRLWLMSTGLATNRILKIRPRFAFGAFVVNGKYYRTYEEIEKQQKKIRSWKDRDGELIGEWVDFLGGVTLPAPKNGEGPGNETGFTIDDLWR